MEEQKGKVFFEAGLDNSDLRRQAEESKNILSGIGQHAQQEGQKIDDMAKKLGAAVAGVFAVSELKKFVTEVATVRGEFQKLEVSFKTMLGSEEKASDLMSQLTKTAMVTPFGMSDIANSAKQLLAYGLEADKVNDTLIRLGDIAAGLSIPINDLAYLYGTTMVQGRMYTQDLNQFLGRGIPIMGELANQFGVAESKVKDLVQEGKIGFPQLEQAIISLTSEGSMFGGLMAENSKTIAGQISNLEDQIEQIFNTLGQRSEGVINSVLDMAGSVLEYWEEIGKVLITVIAAYGSYKAAVLAVAAAHKLAAVWGEVQAFLSLTKAVTSAKDAMLLLNMATKANPIGIILSVVATAATAFSLFGDKTDKATDALKAQQREAEEFKESVGAAAAALRVKYEALQAEYAKCKTAHEKREWISKSQGKFKDLGIAVKGVTDAENIFVKNTTAMLNAFKLRAEATVWQSKVEGEYAKRVERQLELEQQRAKITAGTRAPGTSHDARTGNEQVDRSGNWVYTEKGAAAARAKLSEANDATIKAIDAEINKYTARVVELERQYASELKTAGSTTTEEPTKKEAQEMQRIADAKAARLEKLEEYRTAVIEETKAAELDIEAARIDAMEEGYAKTAAQINLNYNRLIAENKQREQDMIDDLADARTLEWQNANPKATKEQTANYRAGLNLTAADLSPDQQAMLAAYKQVAEEMLQAENKKALEQALNDVRTYEQQRLDIEKEYAEKRAALYNGGKEEYGLKEGATQGNIDELNYQEEEALKAVDEQFAARQDSYVAWCEAIGELTLGQLESVLAAAKKELDDLTASGVKDSNKLSEARAKVTKAQEAVNKKRAKNDVAPDKRSIKEWEDLYKTLQTCASEFDNIGDAIGGVAGEAIKTAGSVMTSSLSMINGIVQLVQMSSTAMTGTATAAATAIKTVETASIVLTVISAALSIAMTIVNLFNSDEAKEEQIEALQTEIDNLQWQVDNADTVRLQEEYGTALSHTADAMKTYTTTLWGLFLAQFKTMQGQGGMITNTSIAEIKTKALNAAAGELVKTYGNMGYAADKALGGDKFKQAQTDLENYSQQMLLVYEQMQQEQSKKDSDSGKVQEYEQTIEELGQKAVDVINEAVEEIIGGNVTDIAEQLGDAFIEAFQEGEDAAEAWGEAVNDIVADILKRMLISQYLEQPLGEIFDKYKQKWYKDGQWQGTDAVVNSMADFANDLAGLRDQFSAIWDTLPEEITNMLKGTAEASREASQEGIASASQESIDELNGRMTTVQSHTFNISENSNLLVETSNQILAAVMNINDNAESIERRLAAVEAGVRVVREVADDISMNGIKIK